MYNTISEVRDNKQMYVRQIKSKKSTSSEMCCEGKGAETNSLK